MKTNFHYLLIAWEKEYKQEYWEHGEQYPEDIDILKSHYQLAKYDRGFLELAWSEYSSDLCASWLMYADGDTLLSYLNQTETTGDMGSVANIYRARDSDFPIEILEEWTRHSVYGPFFKKELEKRTIDTTAREQKELV